MLISTKVPEYVKPTEIFEWEQNVTPLREGVHVIYSFVDIAGKHCNWLLFYCWCYARTQGFTNKCMRNWDFGNFGGQYESSRAGIQDALSEFLKHDDTSLLAEQQEVEKLYTEMCGFCRTFEHTQPHPLPQPEPTPVPVPVPAPQPVPEPTPEPSQPSQPENPQVPGKTNWKKWVLIAVGVLTPVAAVVRLFVPGVVSTIIDGVLKLLSALAGIF